MNIVQPCPTQAPSLHGNMDLKSRVECAIAGLVLWDLWSLTAADQEKMHNRPKGSLRLAPQTKDALQSVAATVVAIASDESGGWYPWTHAHGLSELPIERFFGEIRSQFPQSDVSARAYFQAQARILRSRAKASSKETHIAPTSAGKHWLTASELLVLVCLNFDTF